MREELSFAKMQSIIMSQTLKQIVPTICQSNFLLNRAIHSTSVCLSAKKAGKYKITKNKNFPLTYEMANAPQHIQHRKTWNSFNSANLADGLRASETAIEDMFIRKFLTGTFPGCVASEVIIKRQFNHIRIAGIMLQTISPRKFYFLMGYTEEMLAGWLQSPVTLEIQTVSDKKDVVFKYI